jgi:hypothetical protein
VQAGLFFEIQPPLKDIADGASYGGKASRKIG